MGELFSMKIGDQFYDQFHTLGRLQKKQQADGS